MKDLIVNVYLNDCKTIIRGKLIDYVDGFNDCEDDGDDAWEEVDVVD